MPTGRPRPFGLAAFYGHLTAQKKVGRYVGRRFPLKILVVEDDPGLREGLVDLLSAAGHRVVAVAEGESALVHGADPSFDLLLLDLMLPKLDGIGVCKRLRDLRPELPILMLTALGAEDDKVHGLRSGADDYVTKPFGTRELLARIEALGRRRGDGVEPPQVISADGLTIDLGRCVARREGAGDIPLTAREAAILRWLYQHRERAVSRAELLERVWNSSGDLQTRTVDMTMANLRQKIERDPAAPRVVVTVKRIGYAWGEE